MSNGIGWAVTQMKSGSRVRRPRWSTGFFLTLERKAGECGEDILKFGNGEAAAVFKIDAEDACAEDWGIA